MAVPPPSLMVFFIWLTRHFSIFSPCSTSTDMLQRRRYHRLPKSWEQNWYILWDQKFGLGWKRLMYTQGMLDMALLASNASQLKYLMQVPWFNCGCFQPVPIQIHLGLFVSFFLSRSAKFTNTTQRWWPSWSQVLFSRYLLNIAELSISELIIFGLPPFSDSHPVIFRSSLVFSSF